MCVCDKGKWKTVPSYAAQKAHEKHNIGLREDDEMLNIQL